MILEIRNKYMSINKQKMNLLPKATKRYVFSKVATFETLLVYATKKKIYVVLKLLCNKV